ncbi:MAG: fructosamine kinase, partial [Arsenicicoccus sp.]
DRVAAGGERTVSGEEAFGRELAALHRTTGARYGAVDGEPTAYLGDCPVDLALADAEALAGSDLGPVEPPTLVHGDLWAGNRLVDRRGRSWLIDPCAHYAHREVDLAMMQLFGGFSGRVYAAYAEDFPLAAGWRERVAVFQTVPLLVHVLLFGGGYAVQAGDALRAARG